MQYRSTNHRFTHFGGDVVSNVESSHGVQLSGGSTGGIVEAVGDDANISLTIRGKGTGGVTTGNSSNASVIAGSSVTITSTNVVLNSTQMFVGTGSTTPISQIQRFIVEFTEPDLAASSWANSTYTVLGLTTNCAILSATPRLNLAAGYMLESPRCSTADELTIRWGNIGGSTISGSTNRLTLVVMKF